MRDDNDDPGQDSTPIPPTPIATNAAGTSATLQLGSPVVKPAARKAKPKKKVAAAKRAPVKAKKKVAKKSKAKKVVKSKTRVKARKNVKTAKRR